VAEAAGRAVAALVRERTDGTEVQGDKRLYGAGMTMLNFQRQSKIRAAAYPPFSEKVLACRRAA
jgi:hypothetical protein